MNANIRIATASDIPAITEIYNQAIAMQSATADTSSVSIESRHTWLSEHAPHEYPVFVAEIQETITDGVLGWCSLSPYRPGRGALKATAEISYYVHEDHRRAGVGSGLIAHALEQCPGLGIKSLFAILLDINTDSTCILEKFGFEQWGHMPNVADFGGDECGHLYYGRRVERVEG